MLKFLLSSAAVAALCSTSFAADLPARTPSPAPAPAFVAMNWSGFYAGVQAGVSQQRDNYASTDSEWNGSAWVADPLAGVSNMSTSSFVGGLHAGFNHQVGTLVIGLEGDIEGTSGKNSYSVYEPADSTYLYSETWGASSRLKWQGSVRARVGVAMDRALVYVTGGVAAGQFSTVYSSTISLPADSASNSYSDMKFGYTVGAGLQYALTDVWSVRAEYRYTDFGKLTHNSVPWLVGTTSPSGAPSYSTTEQHKLTSHAVRVGLSYAFGGSQKPVVARY